MGAHGGAYTHSGFTPRVGLRVHPRVGLRAKVPNYTVLVVKVAKLHRFPWDLGPEIHSFPWDLGPEIHRFWS